MQLDRRPELFIRIGYDPVLEARALEGLARRDLSGCRRSLGQLVRGLRLDNSDGDAGCVGPLLIDVLHRVNRRLHPAADDEKRYQEARLAIIRRFADADRAGDARPRFLELLDVLLDRAGARRAPHAQVARAIRHIEADYRRRISLSSVAQRLALSPAYLSRLFRRETGMTLTHYVQQVRLRHTMALLAEGERTCSEIAYAVGYQNYRDFHRNVVKFAGDSPRQIRRRLHRARVEPGR